MAYTTINKSSDYFNTKLYTGNATDNTAITGVGHQPSFLWGKNMTDNGTNWYLIDAVRGVTKEINSNNTDAEGTDATLIKSFNADGFTLGDGSLNQSGKEFISWNWKANNQGSSNTDGTINTTYTSANTTSGFSIIKYTGTGSNATIGHGLGVAPKMVMIKETSASSDWVVGHDGMGGWNYVMNLNSNSARANQSAQFQSTAPSSSVITLGTEAQVNGSGDTFICYAFAEKTGFSKFGSYVGNGNADGTFIYTGFKPGFVLIKEATGSVEHWYLFDSKRDGFNGSNPEINADLSNTESAGSRIDILSNGFKPRQNNTSVNNGNSTYIYMAFAEEPLVASNGTPATAR